MGTTIGHRDRDFAFDKLIAEYGHMREEERHGITSSIALFSLAVAALGAISYFLSNSCDVVGDTHGCVNIAGWAYGVIPLPLLAIVGFMLMLFNLAIMRAPYLLLIERMLQGYPGRLEHGPISMPFPTYQHLNRPIFGGRPSYMSIWVVIWLVVWITLVLLSGISLWLWSSQRHAVEWHIAVFGLLHLGALAINFRAWSRLFNSKRLLAEAMNGLAARLDETLIPDDIAGEVDFARWGWQSPQGRDHSA